LHKTKDVVSLGGIAIYYGSLADCSGQLGSLTKRPVLDSGSPKRRGIDFFPKIVSAKNKIYPNGWKKKEKKKRTLIGSNSQLHSRDRAESPAKDR
jgi:hypothetical protein